MRKVLVLICVIFGCISCSPVIETLNVSDSTKLIVSAVEQQGEAYYYYHLNKEGHKKFMIDEYGYTSAKQYSVGDTLIIKIELVTNSYGTIH